MMVRMILSVRNTQRQYLRVSLPSKDANVWTTLVAGSAVKPAVDESGRVMIPLQKSKTDSTDNTSFTVEFIYNMKQEPMKRRGQLNIQLPSCDIPINHLFINVFLPSNFKYSEFTGSRYTSIL